jgi:hypothetical protein
VTYSSIKVTELCPNDIITLIDGNNGIYFTNSLIVALSAVKINEYVNSHVKCLTNDVKMSHR